MIVSLAVRGSRPQASPHRHKGQFRRCPSCARTAVKSTKRLGLEPPASAGGSAFVRTRSKSRRVSSRARVPSVNAMKAGREASRTTWPLPIDPAAAGCPGRGERIVYRRPEALLGSRQRDRRQRGSSGHGRRTAATIAPLVGRASDPIERPLGFDGERVVSLVAVRDEGFVLSRAARQCSGSQPLTRLVYGFLCQRPHCPRSSARICSIRLT
jgi:hypothetical protein